MTNFERLSASDSKKSEWKESRKLQWFDLTPAERLEAASQVHAVVTAQLGAISHSMIEFGCNLEKACAFVRRMAIRNQLPLSQRAILLQHLVERKSDNDSEKGGSQHEVVGTASHNSPNGGVDYLADKAQQDSDYDTEDQKTDDKTKSEVKQVEFGATGDVMDGKDTAEKARVIKPSRS